MRLPPWVVATAVGLLLALPAASAAIAIWQARAAVRHSDQALCPIVALTLTAPRPAHLTSEQAQGYRDMEALSREYGCGL